MLQFQHVCNISQSLELNYIEYPIKDRDRWRFLGSYSGMSLSVVLIIFLVPLQTSPKLILSSELWAVQLLLFSEGSWFNSVTFLKLNVGWLSFFSFFCRLLELSSDKRNYRKINSTLHSSFFKHVCGNWAVCSVAPHWLKMSQWTVAFASVFPCSPAGA